MAPGAQAQEEGYCPACGVMSQGDASEHVHLEHYLQLRKAQGRRRRATAGPDPG